MEINKNNYEAFLLDLMEGKLSAEDRSAVLLFLEKHPEIEFDYDLSLPQISVDDALSFDLKNNLKHLDDEREEQVVYYLDGALSVEEKNKFEFQLKEDKLLQDLVKQYENIKLEPETIAFPMATSELFKFTNEEEELISYVEGLLPANKSKEILSAAKVNPSVTNEINLLSATKSTPDFAINYPNKEELKKSAIIVFLRSNVSYLSIAASLVLLLMVFYPSNEVQTPYGLAAVRKDLLNKELNIQNVNHMPNQELPVVSYASNKINNSANHVKQEKDSVFNTNNTNFPIVKNNIVIEQPLAMNNNTTSNEASMRPYNPVIINNYDENDPDLIAQNQTKEPATSVVQKLQNSAWESVGKVPSNVKDVNKKSHSKRMNMLAVIGNGLKKLGVKKSGAQKIYNEEEDYVEYNVNIAGITISKKELN